MFHYLVLTPLLAIMGLSVLAHDLIPTAMLRALLIGSWALFTAGIGMVTPAWLEWISHLFRQEIRGTVTGVAWGFSNLAGIAGALTSGWALQGNNQFNNFGWLYLGASALATVSITIFLAIRDPAEDLLEDFAPGLKEIVAATRESLANIPFRQLLIGRCLSLAGFCIGPFIALHYLSAAGGGLNSSLVVSLGAAQTAGSAISCMLFGRIGDRVGHRFGMLMGVVFQLASLLSVLTIHGPVGCFLAMLMSGCVGGTLTISYMNLVVEFCPHKVRSAHLMIGNMVVGLAGLLFPVAGAFLAANAGITLLMDVSFLVSAVALAWSLWKVKDPRNPQRLPEGSAIT
jgi:MFS family permease